MTDGVSRRLQHASMMSTGPLSLTMADEVGRPRSSRKERLCRPKARGRKLIELRPRRHAVANAPEASVQLDCRVWGGPSTETVVRCKPAGAVADKHE